MELQDIVALDQKYYMNTFGNRTPLMFERGQGMQLTDCSGNVYQDFFAGIAVTSLGHHHPVFTADIKAQVEKVLHTSSLYYIENQAKLAQLLVEHSCADRAFFCSTGAEANEGAIKLAKIYFYKQGKPEKHEIITLKQSFHGRTLATVAATGQEKYQKPYQPLTPGIPSCAYQRYRSAGTRQQGNKPRQSCWNWCRGKRRTSCDKRIFAGGETNCRPLWRTADCG